MITPARFFAPGELRRTWRQLRKELRQAKIRDVTDWLDWATGLDQSLLELHDDLVSGSYCPLPPSRFEAAKAAGSFRVITVPNVRDVLVYRHIADTVLERVTPRKVKGAFFGRSHAATPVGNTFNIDDDPSLTALDIWLRYNEYRSLTLLNQPYRILVVTDINNYFDSIAHDLLLEHVAPAGLPREAVGVLGKLLETLRPTAGHSSSPRVGLAVDEFDCSRQLAHVFLFAHDHRVVKEFGRNNYVRWMDDQNVGVDSISQARRAVNSLTRSLAEQRLTLNAGKTKFLDPSEVAVHFQLEANKRLSEWKDRFDAVRRKPNPQIIDDFRTTWAGILALPETGKGNWDKIVKRALGMAAELDVDDLEPSALEILTEYPAIAERLFVYFARRNRAAQLLKLFRDYAVKRENLHEFVEAQFFESCLLLSPSTAIRNDLRLLASRFAKGKSRWQTGRPLARASAILCMYWLGSPPTDLLNLFDQSTARALPKEVARAWLACTAARSPKQLDSVVHKLMGNAGDDVARLARFLVLLTSDGVSTIGQYYHRRPRWPGKGKCYDARAWLVLDLCSHAKNSRLRTQTKQDAARFTSLALTWPERSILSRVVQRLG